MREYQEHEISPKIQVNIRKILVFRCSFFSDLQRSTSLVISDLLSKLLYALRATRRYRNPGISSREIVNTYKIVNTYEYV